MGEALGLPHSMVYRQPFPGPGLGVRCLGAITRDRLNALREADAILREEFDNNGLAGKVWQYFIAVPDFKSVGVRDGKRVRGLAGHHPRHQHHGRDDGHHRGNPLRAAAPHHRPHHS